MKNYLKFVVAVFGVTVATFGSIANASAKIVGRPKPICMTSCDNSISTCGTTPEGNTITGNYSTSGGGKKFQ